MPGKPPHISARFNISQPPHIMAAPRDDAAGDGDQSNRDEKNSTKAGRKCEPNRENGIRKEENTVPTPAGSDKAGAAGRMAGRSLAEFRCFVVAQRRKGQKKRRKSSDRPASGGISGLLKRLAAPIP